MAIAINDIVQKFKSKLLDNANINAFCQANFGKDLTVCIGLDQNNIPEKEQCPIAIIYGGEMETGQEATMSSYVIRIDFAVQNSNKVINGNLIEYQGQSQVDGLGNLIWQELQQGLNVALSKNKYGIDLVYFFPIFVGWMDIQLNIPNTLGDYSIDNL